MDRRYSIHMKAEMDVGTNRKAFQINLDHQKYGTFAEIGAGQEVARRFFHVGGAAGTIAKTISAYDMTFSDAIYGPADRFVSRVRLNTMLDHEYDLLLERLEAKLGDERAFFVFADTVAARSFKQHNESHGPGKIQVDLIKFSGPAFANIDNRLMSLQLVSQGLTDAVMFTADGEMVQPSEILHKKAILIERGSFRPVTYATNDMLEGARRQFLKESGCSEKDLVVLMEMTLENLLSEGQLNHADFLARVDILGALGRTVLISKFGEYYRLAGYLSRYTNRMIGLVMGVPSLIEIFDEKYYLNLEGGILEALGRMFKHGLKLYVYPMIDEKTGKITTATQVEVAPNLRSLFQYLIDNRHIEEIGDYQKDFLRIYPPAVLAKLKAGDESWEEMVPPEVVQIIKEREFFGYRAAVAA